MAKETAPPLPIEETEACVASFPMPGSRLDDVEGDRVPVGFPPIVDAHVHLFPDGVFEAIWRWFTSHGWPIRYPLKTPEVIAFQKERGVSGIIGLAYSHKPGMARALNAYMAEVAKADPFVTGLGTVLPGEPDAVAIVEEAFALGLSGIKLHCHVQCFAPDDDVMEGIYDACARHQKPLVMHAGREPKSHAYKCDPYLLCSAERTKRVLSNHPGLTLCVPHLGADEFDPYLALLEQHDNLWLDTTMMLADYFPLRPSPLFFARPERILYGTDFPNLPYAWDRELHRLESHGVREHDLPAVLGANAMRLYGLAPLVFGERRGVKGVEDAGPTVSNRAK